MNKRRLFIGLAILTGGLVIFALTRTYKAGTSMSRREGFTNSIEIQLEGDTPKARAASLRDKTNELLQQVKKVLQKQHAGSVINEDTHAVELRYREPFATEDAEMLYAFSVQLVLEDLSLKELESVKSVRVFPLLDVSVKKQQKLGAARYALKADTEDLHNHIYAEVQDALQTAFTK